MEGSGGSVVRGGGDPFYGTHIPDLHRSFVRFPPKSDAPQLTSRAVGGRVLTKPRS